MTTIMFTFNPTIEEHIMSKAQQGTAIVTGASAGLGKIYADRLARRGYDLVLVARRGDKLAALADTLSREYGVQARPFVADLSRGDDVERLAELIRTDDTITMLVNNAGVSVSGTTPSLNPADVAWQQAINVDAVNRLSLAALPAFLARDRGTLVNIASILGFGFLPASTFYSAGKGHVANLTRALQSEVQGTNVRVQLVAPSVTATEIWDEDRLHAMDPRIVMTAEDCVDAALAGLDLGEQVTFPSVEDAQLWKNFEEAAAKLFQGAMSGKPASRYRTAAHA
jgi:short-subunit dehydrogenase